MTWPMIARGVIAIAAAAVIARGGSATAPTEPHPPRADRAAGDCPVTAPSAEVSSDGLNHGNRSLAVALWPDGKLFAGRLPDGSSFAETTSDGSITAKLGWRREVEGQLTIGGERLDAPAPPLRADIPDGYGPAGFQATALTFPTDGCWKVVGSIGRARLTFVVLVRGHVRAARGRSGL